MNTLQLETVLRRCSFTKDIFKGVFAADYFPDLSSRPCCFIWNLCTSSQNSSVSGHWICIFISQANIAYYFDSAAEPISQTFREFLENNCKEMKIVLKRRVQSLFSDVCGQYCIFFLIAKAKGISNKKIRSYFKYDDFEKNDKILLNWLNSHKSECPCGYINLFE